MEGRVLTTEEAADMLKVHKLTIRKWAKSGRLKGARAGRDWRFRLEDINELFNNSCDEPAKAVSAA